MSATFVLTLLMFSLSLFELVSALSGSGNATYEEPPYHYSGCPGFHDVHQGNMAKATKKIWNDDAVCGKKFLVMCIDGREGDFSPCNQVNAYVQVKIVGYCEGCKGVVVLTEEAFARMATTDVRAIEVAYAQDVYEDHAIARSWFAQCFKNASRIAK
ncbi:Barwin-related endoglucanase [Tripterygium wilfordii]|uniref:Barwin-related endoglucanase n=1 Tax=Tripterygium wilfordii TaxID=458696 RepID=A0A7J7DSD7_TRIWF|nr:Barwin-related endoglucanase [Tripterygium wilfordii]